ncbi:hypothetical protein O3M35_002518 [Rhynocoris fuscipes]|uniref:Uncharacterized protein n=1 Tax=Rhynocoris fuscipes TaxID=488301 RepID=A0AAW1CLP4_9HEMI
MDDDESFNTNNETDGCINIKIHIEDTVDDHDDKPIDEDADSLNKANRRRKRRYIRLSQKNIVKKSILAWYR